MSLFDQQPMGPVPARRPTRIPPDPELERAGLDQPVELIGVVPVELRAAHYSPRRRKRWITVVTWLLILPLALSIVGGAIGMIMAPESIPAPSLAALAVVGLILMTAYLVWRRLRR